MVWERTGTVLTVVIFLILLNFDQYMQRKTPIGRRRARTMTTSIPLAVHNDVARAKQAVRNFMLSDQRRAETPGLYSPVDRKSRSIDSIESMGARMRRGCRRWWEK
jgi:hypothetical protein